jgi:hypothetical protein
MHICSINSFATAPPSGGCEDDFDNRLAMAWCGAARSIFLLGFCGLTFTGNYAIAPLAAIESET